MSKITKKQFLSDVMHEIEMLKKFATKEELINLKFEDFKPSSSEEFCIYGQLSGNCSNRRAFELMKLCCIRIWNVQNKGTAAMEGNTFSQSKGFINGVFNEEDWGNKEYKPNDRNYDYLSALDGYVTMKGSNVKQIFAFLKGETQQLSL